MNDSATTRLVLLLSQLSEFVSANYTSGNMSIVGVGVGQEELLQLVKKYFNKGARPGKGPAIEKAAFHSGEWTTSYGQSSVNIVNCRGIISLIPLSRI